MAHTEAQWPFNWTLGARRKDFPDLSRGELYWALREAETRYRDRLLMAKSDPLRNRHQADALCAIAERVCSGGRLPAGMKAWRMSGQVSPVEVSLAKQIDRSRYNGYLRPHLDAIVTRWSEGAALVVEIADWLIQLQVASSAYPRTFIAAHVRHHAASALGCRDPSCPIRVG